VLALTILAWFSRFQLGGFLPGLYLRAKANLSASERLALFLLFLGYQLFIFNFFFDSSFLNEVFLLLFLLFKCFFSLFFLDLNLQFFSVSHFLRILLLSFLVAYLFVEIGDFGLLTRIRRSLLLLLLRLWWACSCSTFVLPLERLNLSLTLVHRGHFHLHSLFR
jgi:hypothetical protein